MRVAIAGGTGTLGRRIVEAVRRRGDVPVVMSRATGVDALTGSGLDAALDGADAVIDALNVTSLSARDSIRFFDAASGRLAQAAVRAGVAHLVLPSIVGIDRIPHGYYAGKLAQEAAVLDAGAPVTIQRITQFHEFAAQLFERAAAGPIHLAPRARIRPIAAAEAAEVLAQLAVGAPLGRVRDLAGPREERLDEMIRAYARRIGHRGPVIGVSLPGAQMAGMRRGLALPGADAHLGVQTFADWLGTEAVTVPRAPEDPAATSPRA
jgi:uncharacterized protein YbjT (DUF2867 family)